MFAKPNVILEVLGRDEYKLEESKIWPNFFEHGKVPLMVTGFFLVPGKILVAVAMSVKGLCEVPCIAIAKNQWPHSAKDTMDLCE